MFTKKQKKHIRETRLLLIYLNKLKIKKSLPRRPKKVGRSMIKKNV